MPQHPLDMLVQMGGNISMAEMGYRSSNRANRLSEERKIMQMLKMAEQKQKEQSSSRYEFYYCLEQKDPRSSRYEFYYCLEQKDPSSSRYEFYYCLQLF